MLPANATVASFTDWALIKEYAGATKLTSQSPADAQDQFLHALNQHQAETEGDLLQGIVFEPHLWSWNELDLLWAADIQSLADSPGAAASILRFRDSFNFAPVIAHYVARKYVRSTYRGLTMFTIKPSSLTGGYYTIGSVEFLNTALDPARHMMMTGDMDALHALIDTYRKAAPALNTVSAVRATASSLGMTGATVLYQPAAHACQPIPTAALTTAMGKSYARLQQLRPRLHTIDTLGIGYRYQGKRAIVLVSMHFASSAAAHADLQARRSIARTWVSTLFQVPYSQVFSVDSVSVAGSDMIMQLHPTTNRPWIFWELLGEDDLAFAVCPSQGGF
jgi:hypothetical protein